MWEGLHSQGLCDNSVFQCPFHGIIVPRDETGKCINPEDEKKLAEKERQETPDWQDPQLLKEIQVSVIYIYLIVRLMCVSGL